MSNVIVHKGIKYEQNNFDYKTFLCKNTVIAGISGTGKSYLLNDILKCLAPHVIQLKVYSGTAEEDKLFPMHKYTNRASIKKVLDVADISRIFTKASELTSKYNACTEPKMLEDTCNFLSEKYPNYETSKAREHMVKIRKLKKEITHSKKLVLEKINEYTEQLISCYKKYIIEFKKVLSRKGIQIKNTAINQVLSFVNFNRNIVIVLNDLTEEFEQLSKREKGEFNKIFNKGRHMGITFIMLIHKWDAVGTNIRNSANNVIFTGTELAYSFSSLQGLRGQTLKSFNDAIEGIIAKDRELPKEERKFNCMLFNKDLIKFYFLRADPRGKQVFVGISFTPKP
jgi:hypothetical protein